MSVKKNERSNEYSKADLSKKLGELRKFAKLYQIQPGHIKDPLLWLRFHSIQI